jgi:threonine/homoserine/homoserine lactone efflux protein
MIEEYENQRQKQVSQMRTITNYGMGVVFICAGIFFFVYEFLGIDLGREPSPVDKIIGALFVLYGIWRLYRGYKKNYFK